MPKPKICCIFNYAPHYRAPIYQLMDKELSCDFYFGDTVGTSIKQMDLSKLKGFKKVLKRKTISRYQYFWHSGVLKPIFKPYTHYIISGGSKYIFCWILLLVSKLSNKKVYAWGHGIMGNKSKAQTKIDILFYKLCDKVLLYGNFSKKQMILRGIKEEKLEVIYNSLDYNTHYKLRQEATDIYQKHFNNKNPVILYIGRLQKSKKLEQLVAVLKNLNKKANLVFIGKDLGDNNLKKLVQESQLKKQVWFYGPCYNETIISNLIQSAVVCVSPGPVGLTAIHVASYGLPIITNDDFKNQMPEFEVIKDGVNGAFFKNENIKSLTKAVEKWLFCNEAKKAVAKNYSYKQIDAFYNPHYQTELLKKLISIK